MSSRLLRRLVSISVTAALLATLTGCADVKDAEAKELEQRLREQPGVVAAESTAYGTWRTDPSVRTTITVADDITAPQLADLYQVVPTIEGEVGLGGVMVWRTLRFATGGPEIDAMSLTGGADRRALERNARDLLTVRARVPEVAEVQLGGGGLDVYSVDRPDDLPGLLTLARKVAELRLGAARWRFSSTTGGTTVSFDPQAPPTPKQIERWTEAVAALDAVPDGFVVENLGLENRGDLASVRMSLRPPADAPVQQITPAAYGGRLLPLLRRERALMGSDGSFEVTLAEASMISLGNLAPASETLPPWSGPWSAAWEKALGRS
ncbi:MAG: hypothetical protein NTV23_17025 [Propionibacteriales bacterium]|nr:hypothetical protein [Propionibacteriales bacterium]